MMMVAGAAHSTATSKICISFGAHTGQPSNSPIYIKRYVAIPAKSNCLFAALPMGHSISGFVHTCTEYTSIYRTHLRAYSLANSFSVTEKAEAFCIMRKHTHTHAIIPTNSNNEKNCPQCPKSLCGPRANTHTHTHSRGKCLFLCPILQCGLKPSRRGYEVSGKGCCRCAARQFIHCYSFFFHSLCSPTTLELERYVS